MPNKPLAERRVAKANWWNEREQAARTLHKPARWLAAALMTLILAAPAVGQLRVVTYNIAQLRGNPAALEAVIAALHEDDRPGFAVPVSVFVFQEVRSMDLAPLSAIVNSTAPPGLIYAQGTYTNFSKDGVAGAQAMFYRANMIAEDVGEHQDIYTGAGRYTDRWRLRLLGYESSLARFYLYSSHLKASEGGSNELDRLAGVQAIRTNADALPEGTHVIYAGDMNFYHNGEPGYLHFLTAGVGQAVDPLGTGNWNGPGQAIKHSQSPRFIQANGLTGGGMNDRFDFQLSGTAFHDDAGLAIIPGTYRAVGNDGQHYNQAINDGNNFYFPGELARSNALANNLHDASDHIPLAVDYQIPARMLANVSPSNFGRVILGAEMEIGYSVANTAPHVTTPLGADVLNFVAQGSGVVLGQNVGDAEALLPPVTGSLPLATGTVGEVTGAITFSSSNQGVQNPLLVRKVSGTIVRPSNPSFAPANVELERIIELSLEPDSGVHQVDVPIHNVGYDALQALLDVDAVLGIAAPFALDGPMPVGIGAAPGTVSLTIDTNGLAEGVLAADLVIETSDEDLPGETQAALLLTIHAAIGDVAVCPADFNDDELVNVFDLLQLLGTWGPCPDCAEDLNDDDVVNVFDLLMLLADWGACP